jgi:hypothetical protein
MNNLTNDKIQQQGVTVFDLDDVIEAHKSIIKKFYGSVTAMKNAGCDGSFLDECNAFKQTNQT